MIARRCLSAGLTAFLLVSFAGRTAPTPVGNPLLRAATWTSVADASDDEIRSAFSDLKAGSDAFAPARAAGEDWVAAQTNAVRDSRWAKWIEKRRQAVDEWMSERRDRPGMVAGWLQDYVDPNTGAYLQWSPSTPMPPDDPGHAKQRGGWIAHVRFYNVDEILEAARLFRLGAGDKYGKWAAWQLDEYASEYLNLPVQNWNGTSRLFTQSLDEAIGSLTLLEAVRLLHGRIPGEHREEWREKLFLPIAANLSISKRGDHNIAVWHDAAIAAIGMEFGRSDLIADGLDSTYGVRQLLTRDVSRDFFWLEMSLGYQDYMVEALGELFVAASLRGQLGTLKRELWIGQNLLVSPLGLVFPDGSAPTLNDTPPNRKLPSDKLWAKVRRVMPTRRALSMNARALDWVTLIDPQPAPGPVEPLPPARTRLFPGIYGVELTSPDWQALLRYGQRASTHAQAESLTYEVQYRGKWLLRDDGTVGYGSPLYHGFFQRAAAQNVPLAGGDGEDPVPSAGGVTAFSAAASSATVEHVNYRPGVTARRELNLEPGRLVDRVTLESATPTELGFVFNFDCRVAPENGLASGEPVEMPDGPFHYWQKTAGYRAAPDWGVTIECPGQRFRMEVQGPPEQRVQIGEAPSSVKPYRRTGLRTGVQATKATFVITFSPE